MDDGIGVAEARQVANHLEELFGSGRKNTLGADVDLPGMTVHEAVVEDGGASVVVLLSWVEQPAMTFAWRVPIMDHAGRVDEITTEYADMHLIEAIGTGRVQRAAVRPPAEDGLHWI